MNNPYTGSIECRLLDEDYILVLVKCTTCSDFTVYIYETLELRLYYFAPTPHFFTVYLSELSE